jgi:hypothetical protein
VQSTHVARLVMVMTMMMSRMQLASANLSVVELIFNDMFNNDADMAKLRFLPGLQVLVDTIEEAEGDVLGGLDVLVSG